MLLEESWIDEREGIGFETKDCLDLAPVLPEWAAGFCQCKLRYETQQGEWMFGPDLLVAAVTQWQATERLTDMRSQLHSDNYRRI